MMFFNTSSVYRPDFGQAQYSTPLYLLQVFASIRDDKARTWYLFLIFFLLSFFLSFPPYFFQFDSVSCFHEGKGELLCKCCPQLQAEHILRIVETCVDLPVICGERYCWHERKLFFFSFLFFSFFSFSFFLLLTCHDADGVDLANQSKQLPTKEYSQELIAMSLGALLLFILFANLFTIVSLPPPFLNSIVFMYFCTLIDSGRSSWISVTCAFP